MFRARLSSFVLALICLAAACSTPSSASEERAAPAATPGGQRYGQALSDRPTVALADIVASPDRFVGQVVRTSAPIQAVCQHRGCWMDIGADDEAQGRIHVRSLDHALSFPKDSAGKTAEVEGEVQVLPGVSACGSTNEAGGEAEEGNTPGCGVAAAGRRVQLAVRGVVIR